MPVTPASHFAAFCETLTQSEDRWEGEPFRLEPWQKRFSREALDDCRSVVADRAQDERQDHDVGGARAVRARVWAWSPGGLLAAASDRRAGRLFDAAARFVRRHPALRESLRCVTTRV